MSSRMMCNGSRRRKVTGALLAALVAAAGVFGTAGAAVAAPSDCERGLHCSYTGYDYGNDWLQGSSTHKFQNCVDSMYFGWKSYGNIASSAFNNGIRENTFIYSGTKQTGRAIVLRRGTGIANLNTVDFNDTMESGYFKSTLTSVGSALCR